MIKVVFGSSSNTRLFTCPLRTITLLGVAFITYPAGDVVSETITAELGWRPVTSAVPSLSVTKTPLFSPIRVPSAVVTVNSASASGSLETASRFRI